MLNKTKFFLYTVSCILFIFIIFFSLKTINNGAKSLLIVSAKSENDKGMLLKDLMEINNDNLLITYENKEYNYINSISKSQYANIISTNEFYDDTFGYMISSGSFFHEGHMESKSKVCIINKKLAWDMFGHLSPIDEEIKISEEIFTVIGIIDDKSDNTNIYIPIQSAVDETYINNIYVKFSHDIDNGIILLSQQLNSIDISTLNYNFINMNDIGHCYV